MKTIAHIWFIAVAFALFPACSESMGGEQSAREWAISADNNLGTLEGRTPARFKKAISAADTAMEKLGFLKVGTDVEEIEAVLNYRAKDDTDITIKIKEFPEFTTIRVRCGLMGDESLSRIILEAIHPHL